MKEKKDNKKAIRYIILGVLFVVILAVSIAIGLAYRASKEEAYGTMSKASLPTVYVSFGNYGTELHGYVNEMRLQDMRDVIVPVNRERKLDLTVRSFGNEIREFRYWVRSLDGTEYLDGNTVSDLKSANGEYEIPISFSSLLTNGREYHLELSVTTGKKTVHYYMRIFVADTIRTDALLEFADTFSKATYDRQKADFIVNHIQPEDKSQTTDFSRIDIHSKYSMFTFAGLNAERGSDLQIRISELESTQASVTFTYTARILANEVWHSFRTEEFFAVRYRNNRVYLLDYYRTMEEILKPETAVLEKGRIVLGVGSGDSPVMTSKGNASGQNATYTVFVKNRELWSYNAKTNTMNLVFTFRDDQDTSGRSSYARHEVLPVKVTEDGSVDYIVYGYMNRGSYEGEVGICFYRYDAGKNATTRLFYMPVNQSELMLMLDMGTLAYVNNDDVCYLRYGDGIYSIDLKSGESVEVSVRAYPGQYAKNQNGNVVAWAEGESLNYPERLVLLNMDTQTTIVVNAEEGEYVKILDFIGDDVVYGFGRQSDSVIAANIDVRQVLRRILIASTDEKLTIRQNYEAAAGTFILSVGVYDTRVTIQRGKKDGSGELVSLEDDVLLITQEVDNESTTTSLLRRNDASLKRVYYIQIGKNTNVGSQFSEVSPRYETKIEANVIHLVHHQLNAYFVYGYGRLLSVESELNLAIQGAYGVFGVVVDADLNVLWTRGTRDLSKILSFEPHRSDENTSSLAAAIELLASEEGIQVRDAEEKLNRNLSPIEILDGALGEGKSIKLYGCSLQEVLYFLNEGRPVMAIIGNREAKVIVGYDQNNVSIYDPETGETEVMPQNRAAELFEGYNHLFLSYR